MNRLQVIKFLVEETDSMIHERNAYEQAHEDFLDYMKEKGGYSHENLNKARELFPAYMKGSRVSISSIQANLKMIRRLSMEIGG